MKSRKKQMTKGMEQPNQERITMLGEKEIYKPLGILEADTIKPVKKKRFFKNSWEWENYSKPNYKTRIL